MLRSITVAELPAPTPWRLRRAWALPPAGQAVARWHVNPLTDIVAYHFSWAWALLPLVLLGDRHPVDYVAVYVAIMTLNFTHRHFSLPYVYLDRQVLAQHRVRFWLVPLLTIAALLVSPPLWAHPSGRAVLSGVAFFAALWNLWHVYMQKYGILRLYNAKVAARPGGGVPGWVDRLLIFGWMPLYFVYLGPAHREVLVQHAPSVNAYLLPMVDALARLQPLLLGPALAVLAASLVVFGRYEWRVNRLGNTPRLSMALGMTLLSASFLVCNPVKAYLAFAFSHAVEYMVFVWAFQRRRYALPLPHRPLLGRLLTRPWLIYPALLLLIGGGYFVLRYYGQYIFPQAGPLQIGGTSAARWVFFWGVYQSLMHFYYDGFLWRMRMPQVRGSI
jgi:hypothetical protein